MPPVFGPVSPSPTLLKSCAGSSGTTVSPSTTQNSDTSGPSRNDSSSTGWPGVEQAGRMRPRGVPVGRHHHALARGKPVVLDHPRRVAAAGPEPIQRGVEAGGVVDDLARGGADACRGHHVLGERLRSLDPGGLLRRPEAGDTGGSDGVGDADHQGHLGTDHDEIRADLLRQRRDVVAGGDVDLVLVGDRRGARIAGRDGQALHLGVSAQRKQQRMFTGAGSDHEDAHELPTLIAALHNGASCPFS